MDRYVCVLFFFSSRRRHTRLQGDWSSDVCSSDLTREACPWASRSSASRSARRASSRSRGRCSSATPSAAHHCSTAKGASMTTRQLAAACAGLPLALVAASSRPPHDRALPLAAGARFAISFPAAKSAAPLDGRVLLMLSTDTTAEPRFQISDGPNTQLIFGIDVDALRPGQDAVIDAGAFGYPLESIAQVPPGRYRVQALLNRYETFHRSDGHVVKLPPDKGEGQQWSRKPGNLYSATRWVDFDPRKSAVVRII